MAMIKCKECGKEISDQARACPYCGCPSEEAKKSQDTQDKNASSSRVLFVILGIILIVIAFWLVSGAFGG